MEHVVEFANSGDFEHLTALWRMAFADTDEYIQSFFDTMYKDGHAIVSREEGIAVACAYLLPCQTVINGRLYSTYYLYAATTHPSHRNKGHMAAIMRKVEEVAIERGIDFIVLVPAEDYLFNYYAKFGYQTAFYKKILHFTREELKGKALEPDLKDAYSLDLLNIRQSCLGFGDYLNWGTEGIKYAMYAHNAGSGSIAFTSDGYAMYNMGKNVAYIREMCTLSDPGELYTMLLLEEEAERFTFNLPVNSNIHSADERITRVGMLLALNENAQIGASEMRNAYIGLTLG
ncbi:MAG: GNAT family N-acetyltransferase [Oscillospiraceae bacterium]|nr:GNAT family N-acetyltransferase [Candidatus Limimonas coprohippi]MCQ2488116.1 GNAT family N-acetyltransferase [Clostridia bacterium]